MLSAEMGKVNQCKEHIANLSANRRQHLDSSDECDHGLTREVVLLGWMVFSFNEWGRADERCLVLTSEAIYRCREDFNGGVSVCSHLPLEALCHVKLKGRGVLALGTRKR